MRWGYLVDWVKKDRIRRLVLYWKEEKTLSPPGGVNVRHADKIEFLKQAGFANAIEEYHELMNRIIVISNSSISDFSNPVTVKPYRNRVE